jgi:signal transduction histidine kinase
VAIEISDTGPGLGDDPERLFERFARGAQGDGRAVGLGLGLTMARRFLEAQGARITAANRPEGGAVFAITFAAAVKEAAYVG